MRDPRQDTARKRRRPLPGSGARCLWTAPQGWASCARMPACAGALRMGAPGPCMGARCQRAGPPAAAGPRRGAPRLSSATLGVSRRRRLRQAPDVAHQGRAWEPAAGPPEEPVGGRGRLIRRPCSAHPTAPGCSGRRPPSPSAAASPRPAVPPTRPAAPGTRPPPRMRAPGFTHWGRS